MENNKKENNEIKKKALSEEKFQEITVEGKTTGRRYTVTCYEIDGQKKYFVKWLN